MSGELAGKPVTPEAVSPLFDSVWQLLDAQVVFAIYRPEESVGTMDVDGGVAALAWVDLALAQAFLAHDVGRVIRVLDLMQSTVADLLRLLPPDIGLLIEWGGPAAVLVPAGERASLVKRSVPLPDGARTVWGLPPVDAEPLLVQLCAGAADIAELSSIWFACFQVEDARARIAVVYETSMPSRDKEVVSALYALIAAYSPDYPVQVLAVTDLPDSTKKWMLNKIPPSWSRS